MAVILSADALVQVAQAAGFAGVDLSTSVAIALAESGGNASAYNPETAAGTPAGKGSYGLWQIYLNAHPEFQGVNLNDPQTNANAAFSLYSAAGGSFAPWSTYKNMAYTSFVGAANQAISDLQPVLQPIPSSDGSDLPDPSSVIALVPNNSTSPLLIGAVVLGAVFLFMD